MCDNRVCFAAIAGIIYPDIVEKIRYRTKCLAIKNKSAPVTINKTPMLLIFCAVIKYRAAGVNFDNLNTL